MPIVMGTRECKQCGARFWGCQLAKYCPECREDRARERNRERQRQISAPKRDARPKTISCEICGAVVPVRPGGALPKYCPTCRVTRETSLRKEHRAQEREREREARAKKGKRKKPTQTFADIRAIQRRRDKETGRYYSYGQIAAEPYLAQQAAEMAERRKQWEGK